MNREDEIARVKAVLTQYPDDVANTTLKVFRCQDCVCSHTRSLFIKEDHWFPLDEMGIDDANDVKNVCDFVQKHIREGVFNELEHVPVPTVERLIDDYHNFHGREEGYQEILDGYDPEVVTKVLKIFKLLEIMRKLGMGRTGSYYYSYFKKLEDCSIRRHLDLVNMCELVKRLSNSEMFEDFDNLPEAKVSELIDSRYAGGIW